ncbi:MAG TPA: molybdopterin cofactor-binding domain-containing protein [Pseudomonadales bacterium]|nr:molybdopterin cofactor-binding domain-containing protein [Pseudomonadales bacterium]
MKLSRRKFLIGSGVVGGGLLLGFSLRDAAPIPHTRPDSFQPNAWLQITPQGEVIFQLDKAEMGQGVMTSLSAIIGEELDYDPAKMTIEFAGAHPAFKNPQMAVQITGGSTAVTTGWDPLREAGATARAMLVAAAAAQWQVDAAQCKTDDGFVVHPDGKQRSSYGDLATYAAQQKKPKHVELKKPEAYRWVGKSLKRFDSADKVQGKTQFGVDVQKPGMKVAVVVRCPQFGGKLISFDKNSVAGVNGIKDVFAIHSGVAIVADGYWQARKAAGQLSVEWNKGPLAGLDTAAVMQAQKNALANAEKPFSIMDEGDVGRALADAASVVEAEYSAPFFHHSPMEPQNCTALFVDGQLTLWAPTQTADIARAVASHFTGVQQEKIIVESTFLGGGFGRRGYVDFAGEAAAIAVQQPGVPVKLMWSREDDMQHDYYRPMSYHKMRAAVDADSGVVGWHHDFVSTSVLSGFGVDMMHAMLPPWVPTRIARGIGQNVADFVPAYDISMGEGTKIPYAIPNRKVGMVHYDAGIPTGFWRSVSHSFTAFAVESFTDELAYAVKKDPVDFRRKYLKDSPRHLAALNLAVEKSNWAVTPRIAGFGRGVAVHESFGSVVAIVADVLVTGGQYIVKRLVIAVDCGLVINPDQVIAQMEGGAIYGLTATIKNGVEIVDGACSQSNFHDLPVLRMNESPAIAAFIVPSSNKPSGIGEVAVPPVAPAIANALFAATGKRLRDLPLKLNA